MIMYFSDVVKRASYLESRSTGKAAKDTFSRPKFSRNPLGEWIARSAIREHRKSVCKTSVDRNYSYYMDVGGWGLGSDGLARTTFGLVSGPDVLLCTWMNLYKDSAALGSVQDAKGRRYAVECQPVKKLSEWWSTLAPKAAAFLRQIQSKNRGYVLAAARAPFDFYERGQILLVLPDLHLRLRTGKALDLFRYGESLRPLDQELYSLLSQAKNAGAVTAQAGDMYETWESEILLRMRFKGLLEWARKLKEYYQRIGRSAGDLRDDAEYMISSNCLLKEILFTDQAWEDWWKLRSHISEDQIDHKSVIFDLTGSIETAIRAQHPKLFGNRRTLTDHDLRGNHDNNVANRYWETYAPKKYREHPQLAVSTKRTSSDRRPEHVQLGNKNCIWIEHGHKYDWHNNNTEWAKDDHGFDAVEKLVDWGHGSDWRVDKIRSGADFWTDLTDAEMRHFTLLRADELLFKHKTLSLVILGHTHQACLLEVPRGTSMYWLHPHARQYLASKYILKEAKEIALRLPGAKSK